MVDHSKLDVKNVRFSNFRFSDPHSIKLSFQRVAGWSCDLEWEGDTIFVLKCHMGGGRGTKMGKFALCMAPKFKFHSMWEFLPLNLRYIDDSKDDINNCQNSENKSDDFHSRFETTTATATGGGRHLKKWLKPPFWRTTHGCFILWNVNRKKYNIDSNCWNAEK